MGFAPRPEPKCCSFCGEPAGAAYYPPGGGPPVPRQLAAGPNQGLPAARNLPEVFICIECVRTISEIFAEPDPPA